MNNYYNNENDNNCDNNSDNGYGNNFGNNSDNNRDNNSDNGYGNNFGNSSDNNRYNSFDNGYGNGYGNNLNNGRGSSNGYGNNFGSNYFHPFQTQQNNPIPIFSIREMKRMARLKMQGKWRKAALPVLIIIAMSIIPAAVSTIYDAATASAMIENYSQSFNLPDALIDISYALSSFALTGRSLAILSNISSLLSIFSFIFTGAITLSICEISLGILRGKKIETASAFSGFNRTLPSFLVSLLVRIFTILWSVIFLLPGTLFLSIAELSKSSFFMVIGYIVYLACVILMIIFLTRYEMVYFILADNPGMRVRDVISYSITMMRGKNVNYICLTLSFIPWFLLLCIPNVLLYICASCAFSCGSIVLKISLILVSLALFALIAAYYVWFYTYLHTTVAVFYSGASGNFRSTAPDNGENIINVTLNFDTRSIDIQESTPSECTTESNTENNTENNTESSTESNTERSTEINTERSTEINTERSTESNTEINTERSTERNTEINTERSTESNTEGSTEINTERNTEINTENH